MYSKMIAYCGLDCSECEAYQATQQANEQKLRFIAEKWSKQRGETIDPEQVLCDGCRAGKRMAVLCKNDCNIRYCCLKQAIDSCMRCEQYPCEEEHSILEKSPEAKSNLERFGTVV